METGKSSLFSAGALAIMAMLAASNTFAQTSCTSKTTSEGAGVFTITVNPVNQNGRTIYTYTVTGANANKLFVYVKRGLGPDLVALVDGTPSGSISYVTPHQFASSFPPAEAWKVVHHQDGVIFPSIAINHTFTLDVPERFNLQEGLTTLLLGIGSTYQHCGPILGPTTPAAQEGFEGSPVANITSKLCFNDGCCYDATSGPRDNIIVSMVPRPETPVETVGCGGTGQPACQPCTVTNSPFICEDDLQIPFCPPLELGRPPLQSEVGGTCYAPPNLKFPC
jgi:hypothetical protein